MPSKSLVIRVDIDHAAKLHYCQASDKHVIRLGDARLKVRNGMGWDHYCVPCAKAIVQRDLAKLEGLARRLFDLPPTISGIA